jgi:NADPH:quinone reductase-like Zn-dependent oxidoreductase
MKAIIWTKYGPPDVLQLKEIEKPRPKENEILIKVHATTVTAGDCEMRCLQFPAYLSLLMRMAVGTRNPTRVTILGQELAGEVVAVGKGAKQFEIGDQVFGSAGFSIGTYAEFVCLPEENDEGVLTQKPKNMSFEEAATVTTGGLEALHFLRKANLQPGHKILINGAGGSIGTYGVQLARYFGAEVTAVDSAEKLEMLRKIGADHVIDYAREDFTQNGQTYNVIFDVVGKSPFSGSMRSLNEKGVYLLANPTPLKMIRGAFTSKKDGKKVIFEMTKQKTEDLVFLRELIEAGELSAVIDKRYPLEQIVDAHRYVETGRKKGNVVITMAMPETQNGQK